MFTAYCPHCENALDVPPQYRGTEVRCVHCFQQFVALDEAQYVLHETQHKWTKPLNDASRQIGEISERINECLAHQEEYPCYQCNSWVKPFFDYEQVSSGGVALTDDYGMTVYRQNTSTHERVRCRQCGKLLDGSGAAMARQLMSQLQGAENNLLKLRRQASKWIEIERIARTRPCYAVFLRYYAVFLQNISFFIIFFSLISALLILWYFL